MIVLVSIVRSSVLLVSAGSHFHHKFTVKLQQATAWSSKTQYGGQEDLEDCYLSPLSISLTGDLRLRSRVRCGEVSALVGGQTATEWSGGTCQVQPHSERERWRDRWGLLVREWRNTRAPVYPSSFLIYRFS